MTDELDIQLDDRERSEALRLGVSEEAWLGYRQVEDARMAERLGMTVGQYVTWSRTVNEALAKRGGVTLAEWERSRDARRRGSDPG